VETIIRNLILVLDMFSLDIIIVPQVPVFVRKTTNQNTALNISCVPIGRVCIYETRSRTFFVTIRPVFCCLLVYEFGEGGKDDFLMIFVFF